MSKKLSLLLFLAHVSVSALYAIDLHESIDARPLPMEKRASIMFHRTLLPSTTNDIPSLDDLNDSEVPPNWGTEPYELKQDLERLVRAPPLPRLGKFRRYLDDFKDLGRPYDLVSSNHRAVVHLSPEAESLFRYAVCTEFGDTEEFSLWCKRR